jgi:hypothetical protein
METETVQHLVCRCEVLSRQRYNVFGVMFLEPKDLKVQPQSQTCASSPETQGYLNWAD